MNKLLALVIFNIFFFSSTNAQNLKRADSIYNKALSLYELKDTTNAILEFEEVIKLNQSYKNAIFNLAVINYERGNKEKAFNLFQRCVQLKDRNAADLLKKFGQTIIYADTMFIGDLEYLPKVPIQSRQEDLFVNNSLNKIIINQISEGFRKSKILKKNVGIGKKIFLSIYVCKDGRLNADLLGRITDQVVQEEITSILQKIVIIPGKYQDKEVVTWGVTVPVTL